MTWSCGACTFENRDHDRACTVCETPRASSQPTPAVPFSQPPSSRTQRVQVLIPAGAFEGSTFRVSVGGELFEAVVPPFYRPGMSLAIELPARGNALPAWSCSRCTLENTSQVAERHSAPLPDTATQLQLHSSDGVTASTGLCGLRRSSSGGCRAAAERRGAAGGRPGSKPVLADPQGRVSSWCCHVSGCLLTRRLEAPPPAPELVARHTELGLSPDEAKPEARVRLRASPRLRARCRRSNWR